MNDTAPAARWEDAPVSGDGGTGVLVVGDPAALRLVVTHHRFVPPDGTRDMRPPAVAHRLDEVRDLVLAGEAEAAQRAGARRPAVRRRRRGVGAVRTGHRTGPSGRAGAGGPG